MASWVALGFNGLHPQLRPWAEYLAAVAKYNGISVQITSTLRTASEQRALYARYLRGESDLPAAPPGTSSHELGLAFDVVFGGNYRGPAQEALGQLWRSWGGRWAGSVDPVHFTV